MSKKESSAIGAKAQLDFRCLADDCLVVVVGVGIAALVHVTAQNGVSIGIARALDLPAAV